MGDITLMIVVPFLKATFIKGTSLMSPIFVVTFTVFFFSRYIAISDKQRYFYSLKRVHLLTIVGDLDL